MRRSFLLVILAAVIAGGALRFWRLSAVPVALYCDEAFQGYEAYSLLETGADSRGVRTPLFFNVFGVGWEEPLYIYLTVVPVRILGTNEAAARFVAAAGGSLALIAVAGLAFHLGGGAAAAGAAVLMAFSPWAFHFSRIGFQASLLPLFLAAGVGALLAGASIEDSDVGARIGWLAAGAAILTLALYTYVAARLLVPLLLLGFVTACLPSLRRLSPARIVILLTIVGLLALPVVLFARTPEGLARYHDVGLASRFRGAEAARRFVSNYISYFTPGFLLTAGDPNPRHSIPGFGALHPHDLLFLLAGAGAALLRRRPADVLALWWLAIAPLPAAMAADPAHAVRAIGAIPAVYALEGLGAATLIRLGGVLDPGRTRGRALLGVILIAAAASSAAYLYGYFVVYPIHSGPAWQFGLKEAYREIDLLSPGHDSIYVTRGEDYPYIHRLFLFAFPPREYQTRRFAGTKYLFDEPAFYRGGLIAGRESPLFLLKPDEVPTVGILPHRTISYPDGTPAFVIAW